MYPRAFDYFAPRTLDEALELVTRYGEEARVLAGGQSLIAAMKLRFLSPAQLIDINHLSQLSGIELVDGEIRCGALTRHVDIERSALIAEHIPLMSKAAVEIADVQVRNRGTLGGALAQADPAGDWPSVALALGARIRCTSLRGARMIPAARFFHDTYTTVLSSDEIITDVFFPVPAPRTRAAYVKIHRRAGDFAVASVALQLLLDAQQRCASVELALGGLGATPIRPAEVLSYLAGRELTAASLDEAAQLVISCIDPIGDVRGSASYRRRIAGVALRRALAQALEQ